MKATEPRRIAWLVGDHIRMFLLFLRRFRGSPAYFFHTDDLKALSASFS